MAILTVNSTGLTKVQSRELKKLGIETRKFDRRTYPMGSVLVGPSFDGQNLGPGYVPVRLILPEETGRGKYFHEVNLGVHGQRIRQLFRCDQFLLNQQRAREYELSLSEAEDILHWGDQDRRVFKGIMQAWKHQDCTICSKACLEILTARSLDMILNSCPDPAFLLKEFADSKWMRTPGPFMTIHAESCWECGEIVRSLKRDAQDAATRERLAKFFTSLSLDQFSGHPHVTIDGDDGFRAELKITDRLLYLEIFQGEELASSPDRLQMAAILPDGTEVDSSVATPRNGLHFVTSLSSLKEQPFRVKFIPAKRPDEEP